jgi:hypothetical protein
MALRFIELLIFLSGFAVTNPETLKDGPLRAAPLLAM